MPVLVSLWHKQTTSTLFDVIHTVLRSRVRRYRRRST